MKKLSLALFASVFFISGCSSKYFEPQKAEYKDLEYNSSDKTLKDYTYKHMTFKKTKGFFHKETEYFDENGKSLGKFIKINNDLAINGDKLLVISQKKVIKMPNLIFSATKKDNFLAIVFEDNSYGIYDLNRKDFVFKNSDDVALQSRYINATPVFYNDLVLFPLINGNVAVVDLNKKVFVRNLIISQNSINDNVIFLKIVNNKLFMATPHNLILFNPNFLIHYKDDIKYVVNLDDYLYVFTIDGRVIKLDLNLKKIKEIKLPYASFSLPGICNGKIYTVEERNYLIQIDKDLNYKVYKKMSGNYNVNVGKEVYHFYKGYFKTDKPLKIQGCKIYNSNEVFEIE